MSDRAGDYRILRVTHGDNRVRYIVERCLGKPPNSPDAEATWWSMDRNGIAGSQEYVTEKTARRAMDRLALAERAKRIVKTEVLP